MAIAFRTMIVTAADAPLARQIAETLSPAGGINMWISGLSPDGSEPATHFVSTGFIDKDFVAMVPEQMWEQNEDGSWSMTSSYSGDPALVTSLCVAGGLDVTEQSVQEIFTNSDVTAQEPFVAFGRLGLQLISGNEP